MQILAITLSVGLSWLFIFLGFVLVIKDYNRRIESLCDTWCSTYDIQRSLETRLHVLEQQYAALIDKEVCPIDKADKIVLSADSDPGDV